MLWLKLIGVSEGGLGMLYSMLDMIIFNKRNRKEDDTEIFTQQTCIYPKASHQCPSWGVALEHYEGAPQNGQ